MPCVFASLLLSMHLCVPACIRTASICSALRILNFSIKLKRYRQLEFCLHSVDQRTVCCLLPSNLFTPHCWLRHFLLTRDWREGATHSSSVYMLGKLAETHLQSRSTQGRIKNKEGYKQKTTRIFKTLDYLKMAELSMRYL